MVKKNPAVVKAALSNSPEFDKLLTSRSVNSCTQTDGDVPKKSSLLHILVNQNDDSRVNLVIRKGIDVNLQNARGNTALIQALQTPHVAASIVESLIHAPNMDYDLPNSQGKTALHVATETNNAEVVDELLNLKANPNLVEIGHGDTPLFAALRLRLHDVAERLLQDPRTTKVVGNRSAQELVDPSNAKILSLLAKPTPKDVVETGPMFTVVDFLVYLLLGAACFGIANIHSVSWFGATFEHDASAFLIPVFCIALLYSIRR